MEIKQFVTRDMFTSLIGCITVVEACTECVKILFGDLYMNYLGLWIAFIFSCIVSFIRFMFNEDKTSEGVILAIINTVTIFIASVGAYQIGIKPISKILE